MGWWYVVVFVVALLYANSQIPKPQNAKPQSISDVRAPTAAEGTEIGVLFGEKIIYEFNTVWWGDLRTVAIRKKGGKK